MKKAKKRAIWPYLITAVAVIVAFALLAGFAFPAILNPNSVRAAENISEYKPGDSTLRSPASYEELLNTLKKHQPKDSYSYHGNFLEDFVPAMGNGMTETMPETAAEAAMAEEAVEDAAGDFSDTNVRTSGVFEGDIVKTDGRYLYSVDPYTGQFTILDTEHDMKAVYSGKLLDDYYKCREFYVNGDKLYFAGYREIYSYEDSGSWHGECFLLTYDMSDRTAPVLTDTYMQSGQYDSARIADGIFYLITNYYTYDLEGEQYIPTFNGVKAACEDIYYGKVFDNANYYCIGAVSLSDPGNCLSSKAVLTTGSQIYASEKTFFILSGNWITERNRSYSRTDIVSIGYDNGTLTGKAIGSADGYLNDSFSIDEYNGFLRLVTTVDGYTAYEPSFFEKWFNKDYYVYHNSESEQNNSLWILNDRLETISSLEKIQKDELVQSARFMGDTVYFVTFRNTDPLFAADLSDPYNPKMLSGLHLTGFSNYLHPWSENLLLGIGYEASENGMINGVKLSMFDTTNPLDVREADRFVLDDITNANMLGTDYSYKAVLADPEKNLIGFAVQDYKYAPEEEFEGTRGAYYLFSYEPGSGFKQLAKFDLYTDNYWYPFTEDIIYDYDAEYPEEAPIVIEEETTEESSSIFEGFAKENADGEKDTEADADLIISQLPEQEQYLYKTIQYVRGLYINDQFYLVYPGVAVFRYDLNDLKLKDTLNLYELSEQA